MSTTWWNDTIGSGREELFGLRVGIYGSGGAPFHHAGLAAHFGAEPVIVSAQQIRDGGLGEVDVVVFPGGGARAMSGLLEPLGLEGARQVREWVSAGGMYIGSCAGSFLPVSVGEKYWQAHPEAKELHMVNVGLVNGSDSEWEGLTSPGVGRIRVNVVDGTHWLTRGLPDEIEMVHYNGPMFRIQQGDSSGTVEGVLRFGSVTPDFTPSEAFMGEQPEPGPRMFEECLSAGAFPALTADYGEGKVVLYGSHPEFGFNTLQLGWGQSILLFRNALVLQARGERSRKVRNTASVESPTPRVDSLLAIATELDAAVDDLSALRAGDASRWLEAGTSPAFMGLSPAELWSRGISEGILTLRITAEYLRRVDAVAALNQLTSVHQWINHDAPEGQDYGFMGLRQLASRIRGTIALGEKHLGDDPKGLLHAYDQLDTHPYQLVVASYLSSIGLIAAAALAATVVGLKVAPKVEPPTGPIRD